MQIQNSKPSYSSNFQARKVAKVIMPNNPDVTEIYLLSKKDAPFISDCLEVIDGYIHSLGEDAQGIYENGSLSAIKEFFWKCITSKSPYEKFFVSVKNNSRITGYSQLKANVIEKFLTPTNEENVRRGLLYASFKHAYTPNVVARPKHGTTFLTKNGFIKKMGTHLYYAKNPLKLTQHLENGKKIKIVNAEHDETEYNMYDVLC